MKNIIKRVFRFILIALFIWFFRGSLVHASTDSIANPSNLLFRIYKGSSASGTLMYYNAGSNYSGNYITFPANSNPNGQFMSFFPIMGTTDVTGNMTRDESFIITLQMCSSSSEVVWNRYAGLRDISRTKNAEMLFGFSNDNKTCQVAGTNGFLQTYFIKYTTQSWNVEGDTAYQNKFYMYNYDSWGSAVNINVQTASIQIATDDAVSNINQLKMMYQNGATNTEINNKMSTFITNQNTTNNLIQNQTNAINQQTQAQNDTNDFLKDTSLPDTGQITNIINGTNTQNANVSNLVNLIPQTLQVIVNGFNNGCLGGYNLGSLFGTDLILPCINPVDYLGSFLWGVIDSILCLCYLIPFSKWLVNTYNDLTSLKNRRLV